MKYSDLEWAAFLTYYIFPGDHEYLEAMGSRVVRHLRRNPTAVPRKEFGAVVVKGYLNGWGRCRIPDSDISSLMRGVTRVWKSLSDLKASNLGIASLAGGTDAASVREAYRTLREETGPVVTAKLLHLVVPELFVPWDGNIREQACVRAGLAASRDDEEAYWQFLKSQQEMAKDVAADFRRDHRSGSPEGDLSIKLRYEPPKTLAKFLDEYNFLVHTYLAAEDDEEACPFPPPWVPEFSSAGDVGRRSAT